MIVVVPVDPGGLGDGARVFARELRLRLWREHLRLGPDGGDGQLVDLVAGFELFRASAPRLQDWHDGGRALPDRDRPDGRPLPLCRDTSL